MPEVKDTTQAAAPAQEAAQTSQPAPAAPPRPPVKKPAGKGKKKMIKRLIALAVIAAIVGGAGFGMWYLVFREDSATSKPLTDVARINTIQSVVQGYGTAVPKESAAITLNAAGTVDEVYVTVGQTVFAGQELYTIDSQAARDNLQKAQEEMNKLLEEANNLTVRAPFAGKLMDVQEFQPDQEVSVGAKVATLVNDRKLKLSLYFSYAYEHDVRAGQSVQVTVPAVMRSFTGHVEKVNKVSYISPEGAVHFEVVIVFDNPGTLTEGMDAAAVLTAADGSEIYPYQNGQTQFYETREILSKASGPIIGQGNLLNYANVREGEELLYLGSSTIDEKIQNQQVELDKATEAMDNFNAVAPIDGQVFSCTLEPGQNVKEGDTVITISNTTTMVVDIQVDSRNIGFIQAGMTMELTDDYGNPVMGTVTNVAMQGEVGTGTTTYPVTLEVDNSGGTIYNGSWLNYKLVTAESVDCITVPNQCIKRVNDVNGEARTVVFIQADSKPDNAVEIDPSSLGEGEGGKLPTSADGFWPVPVTTGLSDVYNCEITEGLEVDTIVFTGWGSGQEDGMGGGLMIG
ncbi:HlyD family efflux transporter periplasmic adaptor subunit [Colidextribacter sp. OB.20]|uniref:HlyD family efflux transporter periplasmic adaptor subunit n=1 Tax=Colidextribacter sp. OB.20 TaxID=2304568 RepID=UPI00136E98EE|nr:HlyD family efflux transporter periplasmic adaptor subunit [Colidextribacter sp. OB.20]NBI11087.1 HlyD family efflux transporter periplasmic adaptor subunit [Colidextribacter sp. OB.20]